MRRAGEPVERHALQAYDALHLAAALSLHDRVRLDISFLCFDKRLEKAAEVEGLCVTCNWNS